MKIQRLLAIVTYLLNRDIVSASELADKFEVSVRTIQRDIDTICAAGIPLLSVPGAHGGYGIVEGYRLDRQLMDSDDLFLMITSLESLGKIKKNSSGNTLEKIRSLAGSKQQEQLNQLKDRLYIDFSSLSIDRVGEDNFYILEQAVNQQKTVRFSYFSPDGKVSEREVEPLTIVFKWYSWYLYGFCLEKNDYRLFRISRMKNVEICSRRFIRRELDFKQYEQINAAREFTGGEPELIVLKFSPQMKSLVSDYFRDHKIEEKSDGSLIVDFYAPYSSWVLGMILSYGSTVEVVSPAEMRAKVKAALMDTLQIYPD